jgi:hypothetical protein
MNATTKRFSRIFAGIAACSVSAAFAQVDEKCMAQWQDVVAAQAVGAQCKLGDANTAARMKRVEDNSLNCALARVNAAEQAEIRASAAKTKEAITKQMAAAPCPAEAKAYFQDRSSKAGN